MKDTLDLITIGDYKLIITKNNAGSVGRSSDFENANRRRILNGIGMRLEDVYFVNQIHSRKIVNSESFKPTFQVEADGIISACKNEIIAVTVADCMPVFLYDSQKDVRTLLHSGRKGTGIISDAIEMMQDRYQSRLSDITAYLGPSIKKCCYQVSEQIALQFIKDWGESSALKKDGHWYLSMDEANLRILEKIGVKKIIKSEKCTCCNKDFGSYRRDGKNDYNQMFVLSYLNQEE